MGKIPSGLKERWEEFGSAAKSCWEKVPEEELSAREAFSRFWKCMEKKAGGTSSESSSSSSSSIYPDLTREQAKKCKEMGYPVEPHPICVLDKVAEGKTEAEASEQCLKEGKFHGISALACKARLKGEM